MLLPLISLVLILAWAMLAFLGLPGAAPSERIEQMRRLLIEWYRQPTDPVRMAAYGALGLSVLIGIVGYFNLLPLPQKLIDDFYANGAAELASIAITVLIIDRLVDIRNQNHERKILISQMGSPDNTISVEAVRQLRLRGWLTDGSLKNVYLREANLRGANLKGAVLQGAILEKSHLQGSVLANANLSYANIEHAQLEGAFLAGADLHCSKLGYVKAKYTNFSAANLTDSDLRNAVFEGATMIGIMMHRANAFNAQLKEANLQDANLSRVDLTAADLRGCSLQGAVLPGALETTNFFDAKVSVETQLPLSEEEYERYPEEWPYGLNKVWWSETAKEWGPEWIIQL